MRLRKTITLLIMCVFLVSTASAACNYEKKCSYKYEKKVQFSKWGNCTNCSEFNCTIVCKNGNCTYSEGCKNVTWKHPVKPHIKPPVKPVRENKTVTQNDSGITTVKLCRDNVCTVGGNGKTIALVNYNNSTNPTYDQLITFLKKDRTDEHPYTKGYVCADFTRQLHNNAEKAGIRAGFIGVMNCKHAFNIFETVDKGTVYIDCTGQPKGGKLLDKELNYVKGQPLTGKYLFRDGNVNFGCNAGEAVIYW